MTQYLAWNEMTSDMQFLDTLMSDLSEDYWCAGWLNDLEHLLWEGHASGEEVAAVFRLAIACGGWLVKDDPGSMRARIVPFDEWTLLHEEWKRSQK